MLVFPFVSDARKRRLVKRWSRRLLRILNVTAANNGLLPGIDLQITDDLSGLAVDDRGEITIASPRRDKAQAAAHARVGRYEIVHLLGRHSASLR